MIDRLLHIARAVVLGIALAGGIPASAQGVACLTGSAGVAFGHYNPIEPTPLDSVGDVRVDCTALLAGSPVSYDILLDAGLGGSYSARQMSNAAQRLAYNLFADAAHSRVWGNGQGGTSLVSDGYTIGATPVVRHYSVYGRVPALQTVSPGVFSDLIAVTVNY
jgi:spore coat protein U-like protein